MARRGDDDQLVFAPGAHHEVGVRLRPFDEADIHLEARHRLDHVARVRDVQVHLALRMQRGPLRHALGQQVLADGEAGRHAQRRRMFAAEERLHLAGLVEQGLRLGQQCAAVFVEHQPAADAVEQQHADRGFQVGQRAARGRLRARDAVGRRAGAAAARGGHEHFELAQVEAQPLRGLLICFSGHGERYSPLFRLIKAP
jgi:hypothetical protein